METETEYPYNMTTEDFFKEFKEKNCTCSKCIKFMGDKK